MGGADGKVGMWTGADDCVVVFAIVMLARRVMLDVDVGELEGLRYGYKGA